MPDNDKKGNTLSFFLSFFLFFFFFLGVENKLGKCKQGMYKIGNKHAKQTRYAIPTLSDNWRTQPHDDGKFLT